MPDCDLDAYAKLAEKHGLVLFEDAAQGLGSTHQGRHLGKLAMSVIPDDEDFDAAAELAECLDQLAQAGRKERVDFLIEKQRVSGLSEDEKAELRQLY